MVDGRGTCNLDPLQVSLALKLGAYRPPPFQPYLDRTMLVDIKGRRMEVDGEVIYRSRPSLTPMLRYVGQVGINKLHVADRVSGKEFLGWTALGLRKMAVEVSPTKVKIGEIALRDPAVQLITGKDGVLNLSQLMRKPEAAATPTTPAAVRESSRRTRRPRRRSRSMSCGCRSCRRHSWMNPSTRLWPPALRISAARSRARPPDTGGQGRWP